MILVTGHLGFIGSHLIERLNKEGLDYIGIDVKEENDILACDLPDADIVIHLAAQPDVILSVENPEYTCRNNIEGTVRLLERYKDSLFIFASSGGAIQETIESPYGMSKFCAEEFVKMMHDNYVILRFANVFGERSRSVVDYFIDDEVHIFGDGSAVRTYVHVSDIVDAIIMSFILDKGTYILGGARPYTVQQLAEATGKSISYLSKREGELDNSYVKNTMPGWKPTIDAIDYIKEKICMN